MKKVKKIQTRNSRFRLYLRSVTVTVSVVLLILIGYFVAGFFFGKS